MLVINNLSHYRRRLKKSIRYYAAHLNRWRLDQVTFIGITGSSAKTTAVDLSTAILSQSGACQKTQNFNVLSDIARTILNTGKKHRYCIAELAAYGPGTLDRTVRLFRPHIAVITLIGRDHYSAYKSMEAIAAEKEKVVRALPPEGIAVLNIDDPLVRSIGERCNRRIIWFGESAGATLRLLEARSIWPEPLTMWVEFKGQTYEVPTQLHGVHMAIPVLAALGVSVAAGIPLDRAIPALAQVSPPDGRMQVVTGDDGVVFVRDDWKAPAWSLEAPLKFLKDAKADRKVAILGTISDTSGDSTRNYKKICRKTREVADLVVFIGPHAHRALRARKNEDDNTILGFPGIRQAVDYLKTELAPGDMVLLKGSHKADHLVRLILNRVNPIKCWKDHCEKVLFCDRCPNLYLRSQEPPSSNILDSNQKRVVPLLVGLGNPAESLQNTAHNFGHRVLNAIALDAGVSWNDELDGWVCSMDFWGKTVWLLKPGTAMNNNGAMVKRFLERIGSNPQSCFIVYDDADLILGDVRFKSEGGDGGHKGMRSVISALGTFDIPRVRLGIRRSGDKGKAGQFVLAEISSDDEVFVSQMIETASGMLRIQLRQHIQKKSEPIGSDVNNNL